MLLHSKQDKYNPLIYTQGKFESLSYKRAGTTCSKIP